jgi:CheY-like chemotaxis protein/anti-sigma regulatory factor (Ser/Thr protein kinase)
LLTVINDILDFSKIEAGRIELEEHPFDLRRVIEDSLDLVAPRANEKGIDLAYIMEDDVPSTPVGDASRLRQVLVNLLSNAVKFTHKGEVFVTTSAKEGERDRVEFHFQVRDTGIGIPPEKIQALFESFSQVDASTARIYGGTGLGLAICKRLVELMGGRIWAESDPGNGSVFHFTILAAIVRVPMPRTSHRRLDGRRALIVDDNATNRHVLSANAASWGMIARATSSPAEALRWVEAGDPFDVALLDHMMAEMDGVALAQAIRRLRPREDLPIVLLSSGSPTSAADPAIDARIAKPAKPSALLDVIMNVLHVETSVQTPASEAPTMSEVRPLRILLAEDNVVNQKVALAQLSRLGHKRVDVVSNGREAIDAIARTHYDIVLMDVHMPEMDGLEATRIICQRFPRGARPRLVAMTANALQGDREMCLEAGMDDYVSKPVDVRQLAEILARVA